MTTAQPGPRFVSAGEALTDLIRQEDGYWLARAGGAPWNVARVMAGFGISSAFAGSVSRDNFGDEIAALSREAGLDMRFLQQHDKPSLLAIVHETSPPRYYFIGADSADLAFDPRVLPRDWIRSVEWVHCGGISLAREPLCSRLIGLLEGAKAAGARVSFDPNFRNLMTPAYDATLARVARLADVIKVSDEDLGGLFRTRDMDGALAQLQALNPRAVVMLTRGAEGAELHADGRRFHQDCPPVEIVDSVGAGDASIGGLLYSLMHRPDAGWPAHLRRAVAAGTAACLQSGATPPALAAVEKVLAKMN
ncbi:MAG: carbohydrate kinase [Betaproteobacteria bacterium]|nr:carbohydrate kinase [Betaproteobacteria bacterium]